MSKYNNHIVWLKSFFSEPSGKGSSKRLLSFLVVLFFLINYGRITIITTTLNDIPSNWAVMISAIIGLNIFDKVLNLKIKKEVKQNEK